MLGLAGLLILAGAVLVTYSRQSYFIGLLGLVLVMLRRGPGMVIFGLVALITVLPWLPQGAFERVEETKQQGEHGQEEFDDSTASRWDIWAGALEMWAENPAGIGLNRFKSQIGNYSIYAGKDAHNYYVLTLAEAGVQGLLTLLWLMFCLYRLGRWAAAQAMDAEAQALAVGFKIAVVCMALGNIYGSPFTEGSVMACFWALAALVERFMQLRWEEIERQQQLVEQLDIEPNPDAIEMRA
nr:O-antigen ligase family protein [Pseudomarimonas arenosa]